MATNAISNVINDVSVAKYLKGNATVRRRKTADDIATALAGNANNESAKKAVINCVNRLRLAGMKIATGPNNRGYFIARTAAHMADTIANLENKRNGLSASIDALNNW